MRSHRVFAGMALLVAACADPDRGPLSPAAVGRTPSFTLSDAVTDGRAGFYLRPPIAAPLRAYPGTFDATLLPTLAVKVCELGTSGLCTGADDVFDRSSKPALTLDPVGETYGVAWSPPAAGDFRARVYSGATLLGFADIRVVANGSQLNGVPAGYVGMVKKGSLPIRFRVETGVVAAITLRPAAVTLLDLQTFTFGATVVDLHGATVPNPSVSWSSSAPAVATVSVTGRATGVSGGTASILATSGGVSTSATLTVTTNPDNPIAVIGNAVQRIPRADACGSAEGRTCESLIGDVVTDAMRATYGVDFAITNSGGMRADLTCPDVGTPSVYCPAYTPLPYPITRGQVHSVLPFGNTVVTLTVGGDELKTMLENGVSQFPLVDYRFPQVSGLCFTYDISAPIGARIAGAVRQAGDGSCTGAPVDLTAATTYTIAENNFMATGGDFYPNFAGRYMTRGVLERVTSAYVAARSQSGPMAPSIQGRIVCTSSGATACPVATP